MPSMPGSQTSSIMTAKSRRERSARHSSPLLTPSVSKPSSCSMPSSEDRTPVSSSTIRIEGRVIAPNCYMPSGGRQGQIDDDSGSQGQPGFRVDMPKMVGDDLTHDRQAQTGSPFSGREIGQEQAILVFLREAASCVDDLNADRPLLRPAGCADLEDFGVLAAGHGLQRVVEYVYEDALHLFGIQAEERDIGSEGLDYLHILDAAVVKRQCVLQDPVQFHLLRPDSRQPGETGELVYQVLQGRRLLGNGPCAFLEEGPKRREISRPGARRVLQRAAIRRDLLVAAEQA